METLLNLILKELRNINKKLDAVISSNSTERRFRIVNEKGNNSSIIPLENNTEWVNSLMEVLQKHFSQQTADESTSHDKQK